MSRCFIPSNGTRGLWSVSIMKCFPIKKSANFSQAHVVASTSFSIWVYRRSVSDIDLDARSPGVVDTLKEHSAKAIGGCVCGDLGWSCRVVKSKNGRFCELLLH